MSRLVFTSEDRPLREDFRRGVVASTLVGGIVAGVVAVALTVSFAVFVFRDALVDDLEAGAGIILAATVVIALVTAFGSSLSGATAGVQNVTAAVLGVAASGIAAVTTDEQRLGSVIAFMVLASLGTGAFLWLLGRFRLGALVRFVPYTVIGGFIAATGYLIAVGALGILSSSPAGGVERWPVAVPAIVLAGTLLIAERTRVAVAAFPILIIAAVVVLHVSYVIAGVAVSDAATRGWLLGAGDAAALWTPATLGELGNADLGAVLGQLGGVATIALIAALGILLNLHSLETELEEDADLDRELRVAGVANLAAAVAGGGQGFAYLSNTLLLAKLGARRRGAALVAALVVLGALVAGTTLLTVVPTAVAAGLLLYLGTSFMFQWVLDTRRELPLIDQGVLVGIVLVVAVFGLVEGITVGLVLAVALFVVRYSRVDIIKHRYDISAIRGRVDRTSAQLAWLAEHGDRVLVLELRGYLFFGTAHGLVDTVAGYGSANPRLEWVLFDLSGVTGLDATVASAFARIGRVAKLGGFGVVIACGEPARRRLEAGGADAHYEPDLDAAVAWCEDRILEDDGAPGDQSAASLVEFLAGSAHPETARRLASYFEHVELGDGERVIEQGRPAPGLFFIESGRLTAVLESSYAPPRRLLTMNAGSLLGEIGLYGDNVASATVVATGAARLAHLPPDTFSRLRVEDAEAAAHLHELVARTLVARLGRAEAAMRQLRA